MSASPRPMYTEPSIWPITVVALMARPTSWAIQIFGTRTIPVAGSTSTSATQGAVGVSGRGTHSRAAIASRGRGWRVGAHRADRPLRRLRDLHRLGEREPALGILDVEHPSLGEADAIDRGLELLPGVQGNDVAGSLGRLDRRVARHERDPAGVAAQVHRREIGVAGDHGDVRAGGGRAPPRRSWRGSSPSPARSRSSRRTP